MKLHLPTAALTPTQPSAVQVGSWGNDALRPGQLGRGQGQPSVPGGVSPISGCPAGPESGGVVPGRVSLVSTPAAF